MSTPDRPDVLVGRKLPANSLWEQLQRRVQPLALEFCSQFFNNELSYKDAKKWLLDYGVRVSPQALSAFFNSMDMRMRYASLQAAQSAEAAKAELPADIDKATRERIAQHKFELAFMNLGENQRLQLVELQQREDMARGSYVIKKAKLDLDREKFKRETLELFVKWFEDKRAKEILQGGDSRAEQIRKLDHLMFPEDHVK
jgi:hypothetical protein